MPTLTTIADVESTIEKSLEALRNAPLEQRITDAFPFIIPSGYRVRAQLEEDGRKKRNTAAASNWQPESGEIVLYFERLSPLAAESSQTIEKQTSIPADTSFQSKPTMEAEVTPAQVEQCCSALAAAESAGKAFVAFKWFRDDALPKLLHDWVNQPEDRQRVLAKAIELGRVVTSRIPNPKSPQHPTTTVALNRSEMSPFGSRFKPIVVRGEPVSESLMRDRDRF